MKKYIIAAMTFMVSLGISTHAAAQPYKGTDPVGTISYCLPSTTLSLQVEATVESFYAGPYAKYASKYIGVDARTEDETTFSISQIKMSTSVEADQSRRYLLNIGSKQASAPMLKLTSQGLISISDGGMSGEAAWRFPSASKGDFANKGVSSNLTSESAVLYHNARTGNQHSKIAIQQNLVVEKSLEKRASEAAEMIFKLRDQRIKIVTGDTDATYSGQAMEAAINELALLEEEYMSLFIGYSDYQTQSMKFDVVPEAGDNQKYIAFRISDKNGLLPSENIAGKPVLMEIIPQNIPAAEEQTGKKVKAPKDPVIVYRIPSICTVRIINGADLLLHARVPVYQLGTESTYPLNLNVE